MTDDIPSPAVAFARAEALIRSFEGETVTLERYEAVGRAISDLHLAVRSEELESEVQVEGEGLAAVMTDTDAIEEALLALWHNDGGESRVLTSALADAMVERLYGEEDAGDLPEPALSAYHAVDDAREDDALGEAAEAYAKARMAEIAWEEIQGDGRAALAALTLLPEEMADDLRERLQARSEGTSRLP